MTKQFSRSKFIKKKKKIQLEIFLINRFIGIWKIFYLKYIRISILRRKKEGKKYLWMKNRVSESNILLRCLCLNIKMFRSFSKKNNSDIKEKEEEENRRILFLPLRSFQRIHLKHRVSAMKCYEIMIGHWMMFIRISLYI